MNNMPSMPSLPSAPKQESSSGEAKAPQAPFTDESVGNSADSDVGLTPPSHEEQDAVSQAAPQINNSSAPDISNLVAAPVAPKGGIKVVATRKGFYNQMRYKEGDQFIVRSEEDFGEWMMCLDPVFEKKRIEQFKQKRIKARA